MTLIIDPNTQKGRIQIEAIEWVQTQMNSVLQQYFNNHYKLVKGLAFQLELGLSQGANLNLNREIKVHVMELQPETEERFMEAVVDAKKN